MAMLLLLSCSSKDKINDEAEVEVSNDITTSASMTTNDWLPEVGENYEILGYNDGLKGVLIKYSDSLYRGGDILSSVGASLLKKHGIKTIISVTPNDVIRSLCSSYGFELHEVVFDYADLTQEQTDSLFTIFENAEPPLFIHCHSGKRRGGNLVLLYRGYVQSWDFEEAMIEYAALGGTTDEDYSMLKQLYPAGR